jgi:hypothetical protein
VHYRVAAEHRLLDRRSAGHVPDHGIGPGHPQRIKGGRDPVTSPDQQPDLVALPGQRGYRMAADISGPTGDQHPHRQLPTAAGAEHSAVQPGGKPLLVAASSLGLQALTTPSEHGLKFADNLFGGIGLWTSVTTESWRQ